MRFTNYGMFRKDLNEFGIEYAAEHTKKMGFDAVEFLSVMSKPSDKVRIKTPQNARCVKSILDAYELPVSCYSLGAHMLSDKKERVFSFFENQIEIAAELGAPYFHHTVLPELVYSPELPPYEEIFSEVIDIVEAVAKHANSLGLTALYEPQGMYFNGITGLSKLYSELAVRGVDVGICYDFGNPLFVDTMPEDIGNYFAGKVKHIHVKDYIYSDNPIPDKEGYVTKGGKHLYDVLPGAGFVNFEACFKSLQNYTGDVSFEITGSDEEMKDAIEYIEKIIRKTL